MMALNLSWLVLFHSHISLFHLVIGSQQAFLSVSAPVTYVVAGRTLILDCTVNGTALSIEQVSWKHDGKWFHNMTRRTGAKVQLNITRITSQQHGIYFCTVFNFSGQSQNGEIPQDANVTVLVGGPIAKPQCVSNGRVPPKISLVWNIMENKQSDLQFTYNVLYCYKNSRKNKFCVSPPFGYNISTQCSDLSINSSASGTIMYCNVTYLFQMAFPNLFNHGSVVSGRPTISFVLNFGNVESDNYSPRTRNCNALLSMRCTKPDNILVRSIKKRTVSLVWDAPKDMEMFKISLIHYVISFAADGADKNQTTDFLNEDPEKAVGLRYDFRDLHPNTLYHFYIACAASPLYGEFTQGEYIGPFSVRTQEEVLEGICISGKMVSLFDFKTQFASGASENWTVAIIVAGHNNNYDHCIAEPSDYPRIDEHRTSTMPQGQHREVHLTWTLPNKETWNGNITGFVLQYWTVNGSMAAENDTHVMNVSGSVSNSTVSLVNLRSTYAFRIQMCTRVGCGPWSPPFYISVEKDTATTHPPRKETYPNIFLITGITLGLILFVLCSFIVAYVWRSKIRKRKALDNKRIPLSEVLGDLTPSPLYDLPEETKGSGDYDETCAPLLNGKPEYVRLTSSPYDPAEHDTAHDDNSTHDTTPVV